MWESNVGKKSSTVRFWLASKTELRWLNILFGHLLGVRSPKKRNVLQNSNLFSNLASIGTQIQPRGWVFPSKWGFTCTIKISICNGPFLHKWTYSLAGFSLTADPDNSPAAALFDLPCFLNLGCQGSAVGGCLLYFKKKGGEGRRRKGEKVHSPHTMTNPKWGE